MPFEPRDRSAPTGTSGRDGIPAAWSDGGQGGPPLVVHLLPEDLPRGAQIYAREIRDRLDGDTARHRTLTIYGPVGSPHADLGLGLRRPPDPLRRFDLRIVFSLRRVMKRLRPAILIAHGGEPLKYAALAVQRPTRLVYLKIGSSRTLLRPPLRRFVYAFLLRRCDLVVGVSSDMVAEARELLAVPLERVVLVPNGRNPASFRTARHRTHSPIRLCFVGHFTASKRPERFVELVETLQAQGFGVTGVMAGDGPLSKQIGPVADAAGVELLGVRNDVPEVLAASDCFIFTSIREGEGMPGVLIEAGLAGLPIVTTDVAGARDVVEDGVSGFVVSVEDFNAMIAATVRLALSTELRARMGAAARKRCIENFSLEASATSLERALEPLLASADT